MSIKRSIWRQKNEKNEDKFLRPERRKEREMERKIERMNWDRDFER